VLASTPGSVKPIFLTVSKSIVLRGMGECDYRQEQEPFQGGLLQLRVLGFEDPPHPAPPPSFSTIVCGTGLEGWEPAGLPETG
jgi:hypothetical protein